MIRTLYERNFMATTETAENGMQNQTAEIMEEERVYVFRNDVHPGQPMITRFFDVVQVVVCEDGSHEIYTADGGCHWVAPDFVSIQAIPCNASKKKE